MAVPLFELLIDVSLAALLLVTIVYCAVLNRRIRVLQDSRGELAKLLKHFDESTRRAADSIGNLQNTGKRVGEIMQARMERATQLADDLQFLTDHAEKIADRLEAGISVGRTARRVQEEMSSPKRPLAVKEAKPEKPAAAISQEEESVMRAAVRAALEEDRTRAAPPPAAKPTPVGSLQAMIEKIANRAASDPSLRGQRAAKFPETRARSRVEQELLEIIRADKG